jgi:hypothetical protein
MVRMTNPGFGFGLLVAVLAYCFLVATGVA